MQLRTVMGLMVWKVTMKLMVGHESNIAEEITKQVKRSFKYLMHLGRSTAERSDKVWSETPSRQGTIEGHPGVRRP